MNSPDLILSSPVLTLPTPQKARKGLKFGWLRLVAGNPFYLFSPVLLLYGLFKVATEPEMLGQEATSLAFNFSSLGLYEMLLVVTAIWLAGRQLRYDAGVLMWMENLLLFVPFLLLSQASFLSADAAIRYAVIGVLLAVTRWTLQYRYFPQINLPLRLMMFGFGLLLLNAGFPLLYHHFVTVKENNWIWPELSFISWTLILPAVMLLGNWLCKPVEGAATAFQGRWLPLTFYAVWIIGTAVNLRAINYVDDIEFRAGLVVPVVWALVWTMWLQSGNISRWISYRKRDRLLWLPVVMPTVCGYYGEFEVLLGLVAANAVAVASLGRRVSTKTKTEALFISGAIAFAGMPEIFAEEVIPFFTRGKCVLLAVALYAVSITLRRPHFRAGMAGALLAGLTTQYYFGRLDYLEQFALDTALMFALIHSLSWRDTRETVGRPIRFALGMVWVAHSIMWVRIAGEDIPETAQFISGLMPLSGLLVMSCFAIHALHYRRIPPVNVPIFGALVVLTVPINGSYETLKITPPGYLAVLGSFLLFAAGTGYAFVRDKIAGQAGDYFRSIGKGLTGQVNLSGR